MVATAATPDGTRRFRDRLAATTSAAHFRDGLAGLTLASLGFGTYLGNPDDVTDAAYGAALVDAVRLGVNVVDTASNYRAQRSERVIGQALAALFDSGALARDEVVVCTKGGYLPFDGSYPADPSRWFYETYVKPGLLAPEDIVGNGHSLAPRYLLHQLERSRANLRLDAIDVYYLHNPESQLVKVGRAELLARIGRAFAALERSVADGKLGCYGIATWSGLRAAPNGREYLALADVVAAAEREVGPDHHFRVVQLPVNLAMTEAVTTRNQPIDGRLGSLVEAADHHGITVIASASLLQGKLAGPLPDVLARAMTGCTSDPQRAIQFVRSTPGVTVALVGMRRREHVAENLALARLAPASREAYLELFTETGDA
jgi:aryl-alcohol dehydrogenase-like predicted oxidoreductase